MKIKDETLSNIKNFYSNRTVIINLENGLFVSLVKNYMTNCLLCAI